MQIDPTSCKSKETVKTSGQNSKSNQNSKREAYRMPTGVDKKELKLLRLSIESVEKTFAQQNKALEMMVMGKVM